MLQTLQLNSPSHFEILSHNPQIKFALTNVEMALKSASLEWMHAYSQLEPDPSLRHQIMDKISTEFKLTNLMLDQVFGAPFEQRRPRLEKTIAKRKDMLDVLHQFQIHALTQWRKARSLHSKDEDDWLLSGLITMNAISNGLRGTG